jgi:hypothetical protein
VLFTEIEYIVPAVRRSVPLMWCKIFDVIAIKRRFTTSTGASVLIVFLSAVAFELLHALQALLMKGAACLVRYAVVKVSRDHDVILLSAKPTT